MPLPPHSDPGTPDSRGPGRYLWWLVTSQRGRVLRGTLLSTLWMAGLALEPYFIRGAIDHGLTAGDPWALTWWTLGMAVTALLTALVGVYRHRAMTFVRTDAAYRTVQVVTRRVVRLGATLRNRVATGEVVTIGTTDIRHVAETLTATGPGVGSLGACVVVAVLLLSISPLLGSLVLLGVPAVAVVVLPLLGRLQRAEAGYRGRQGELTVRASDMVAGLRVLRGMGGEALFAGGYRGLSQALRVEGYRVGAVSSWVRALAAGLPALFVALVAWLAARMVAQGAITVGDLVAVYAYAVVLAIPIAFIVEGGYQLVRGLVAARRVVDLLNVPAELADPVGSRRPLVTSAGSVRGDLHDPDSGLTIVTGQLTAVVAADSAVMAALADRLGRYVDSAVTIGGVPLAELPLAEVRERILVGDGDAHLFAGTLRDLLWPAGQRVDPGGPGDAGDAGDPARGGRPAEVDEAAIERCLWAASAEDIVAGLPQRLATAIGTNARTLSGGQRQRIRLARALLANPEVLILLDPTSAVDAHTEAAIADRLRQLRAGRTTVVTTTSPLLLDRADRVAFLAGGRVAATGSHTELLTGCADYRALVARGTGPPRAPEPAGAGR